MPYRDPQRPEARCRVCEGRPIMQEEDEAFVWCEGCDRRFAAEDALLQTLAAARGKPVELIEFPDGSDRARCPVCGDEMEMVWLDLLRFDRCPLEHGVLVEGNLLEEALAGKTIPPELRAGVKLALHRLNTPRGTGGT